MSSEYIKYQLKDVKPAEKPPELTPKEKLANWFYYHKWHLLIGAFLVGILLDVGIHAITQRRQAPEYQIAYVGSIVLPEDTISALEEALARVGTDINGDGQVRVTLNSYMRNEPGNTTAETGEYAAASEVQLIGDMEKCESYFFIVDDPERFQIDFQVLAAKDGSLKEPGLSVSEIESASETASSSISEAAADYYAVPLTKCKVFADALDGTYSEIVSGETTSGSNRDLLNGLYLARRGFPEGRECANKEACDLLWEKLAG